MSILESTCSEECLETIAVGRLSLLVAISMLLAVYAFTRWLWSGFFGSTDQVWNIAPAGYTWICVFLEPSARGVLAAGLCTIWSIRLTYNFARKGGFREEDYRWPYMRAWFSSKLGVCCFFFWFTAIAQNLIILGFSLPAYALTLYPNVPIQTLDLVIAAAFLGFIALETLADQQQWNYQTSKRKAIAQGSATEAQKRGFLAEGLFRYSRHPNVFAETMIWWMFYGFAASASGQWLHWSIGGVVVLTLIFQGSVDLTEKISASKYPQYAVYQRTTSKLVPWPASLLPKQD